MKRKRITKVTLRPVEKADVDLLYRWNNEDVLGKWQGCEFISQSQYFKRYEAGDFNNKKLQLLVVETKEPTGLFSINFPREGIAQFGLSLAPAYRNCGIAYKALLQAIEYVFNNYQVERIEADTDVENDVAARPLLKAGFKFEGVLRKYRFHHGRFHDAAMYSLLRSDR